MDYPNLRKVSQENAPPVTLSRRQLLKALLAAGGAASVSMLPAQWTTPAVEVGVLPAHAQVSGTPTPTATPIAPSPLAINSITFINPETNSAFFHPTDKISTYANIVPTRAGVPLHVTIWLQQGSHPQDGIVAQGTRYTRPDGRSHALVFDTSTLHFPPDPGPRRYKIEWRFENPSDGWNSLEGFVDILPVSP